MGAGDTWPGSLPRQSLQCVCLCQDPQLPTPAPFQTPEEGFQMAETGRSTQAGNVGCFDSVFAFTSQNSQSAAFSGASPVSPRCAGHLSGRTEPAVPEDGFPLTLAAVPTHHCIPVRGRDTQGIQASEPKRTPSNDKNPPRPLAEVLWVWPTETPWLLPGPCPISTRYRPVLWNRGPHRPGWLR